MTHWSERTTGNVASVTTDYVIDEGAFAETRLERAQAEAAFPSLTGGEE